MIPEFTVPHLPKPYEAYRLQRPYLLRRAGISDAQYAAESQPYFDAVLAIDVYLLQEADQYRYWFECGDMMELNACVRAMENAAWSRKLLTLTTSYLAWSITKGEVVTDLSRLLTLPPPPKPQPRPIEITPVRVPVTIGDTTRYMGAGDSVLLLTGDYVRERVGV